MDFGQDEFCVITAAFIVCVHTNYHAAVLTVIISKITCVAANGRDCRNRSTEP